MVEAVTVPWKPKKPCCHPGCPALTHERFCDEHQRKQQKRYDAARGTAVERGYGTQWRKLRALILRRDPFCMWPGGCGAPSTDVDHVVARRKGGTDHASNLRGLCHMHHSMKTAQHDGRWGPRSA